MSKKLQDYIHFYLGCRVVAAPYGGQPKRLDEGTLVGINNHDIVNIKLDKWQSVADISISCVKPILRKLDSITDEEKTQIGKMAGWYEGKVILSEHHLEIAHDTFKEMAYECLIDADDNDAARLGPTAYFSFMPYLTNRGVDLFGLIDAGLAIDANTLKQ